MRKLAWFASAFGGAALLSCQAAPLDWLTGLGLTCGLGAAGLRFALKNRAKRFVLLLAGLSAGFLWFRGWTDLRLAPVRELVGMARTVSGLVTDYPVRTSYGWRADVTVSGVPALLYVQDGGETLVPGDRVQVTASITAADFLWEERSTVFTSQGYFLRLYAKGDLEAARPDRVPLRLWPALWARALRESIRDLFPEDVAGLAAAVVLGEKTMLAQDSSSALSRAGLAHVTAVSGLHVGYLVQMLMLLCRKHRRLTAALAIPALILFALLTGASPGTVRAVVMQTVLLLAPLLGRENDGPTSLSFALMLLLLWNPYAAASVSLQLSFAAVAGILLVSGPVIGKLRPLYAWAGGTGWQGQARKVCLFLCSVCAVTLGATLFTAPLGAIYFGSVSLAGVLANLAALWAGSGLFAFGLTAALAGLAVPVLGAALGIPAVLCARWVLWIAGALSALNLAALPMDIPYFRLWLWAVYLLAGLSVLLRRQNIHVLLPVCGGVVLLLAAVGLTRADYAGHDLSVTALDVGQGASTAFLSGGKTVLVDCGGNGPENAGDRAADWFQALGAGRLDLLVLTHFDEDHFNGVEQLFRRMDVGAVVIPLLEEDPQGRRDALCAWAAEEGAGVTAVRSLTRMELGKAVFTFYPPLGTGSSNEAGVSVLCTLGEFDVLITGDADAAIEAMLVKYFDLPDVEVLVAGHHGSENSTSAVFLAAVAPDAAIISSGENAYGHPDPETLARLEAAGTQIFRTDTQGTVTITVDKGE